jgi:AcrR family transcriptional regulator
MKDEGASQDWVAAGLAELATAGVDGVGVEVLAERLGVTKGGFYRRFKERRSLLDAILKTWRDGRIAAIERQVETGGKTAMERIKSLIQLMFVEESPRRRANLMAACSKIITEVRYF